MNIVAEIPAVAERIAVHSISVTIVISIASSIYQYFIILDFHEQTEREIDSRRFQATYHLNNVAKLQRKSDSEIIHSPVDFAAWEPERSSNRGLTE